MTARSLVALGGGEHALVVIEAARSRPAEWHVLGYADRDNAGSERLGVPHLGDDRKLLAWLSQLTPDERPWIVLSFVGAGALVEREKTALRFGPNARWARIIHAAAWVSPSAVIGEGTVVLAGAVVNGRATLGDHAIVNSGAVVEHDADVGSFAHIGPRAVVGGGARVGRGALVALGALVRDHVTIGDGATVGMGGVVVADVAPGAVVVGNPARPARS